MFVQDYVVNGQGHGPLGSALEGCRFDAGFLRPYFDKNGKPAVTINTGRTTLHKGQQVPIREHRLIKDLSDQGIQLPPVCNSTSLRKEEWLQMDRQVQLAARYELSAWADLVAKGSYGGFNGMGKMILEWETMSDPGEAQIDMDGLTQARNDSPLFQLEGLPLPITQAGFRFSQRRLNISRNSGTPLNTTMGEAAARRVAESVEKVTIGNNTGITYGGASTHVGGYGRTSKVYGYTNFPPRLTKTNLTTPTGSNPEATVADVLAMRDQLTAAKFRGPFMLYHSNDWDQYMDNDYARLGGNNANTTLRKRLMEIGGIQGVKRLDMLFSSPPQTNPYYTSSTVGTTGKAIYRGPGGEGIATAANPFTLLMVQMTPDVAQAVVGMDITTIQWESMGGMQLDFKVMGILVPWLKADFYGSTGILHASTS